MPKPSLLRHAPRALLFAAAITATSVGALPGESNRQAACCQLVTSLSQDTLRAPGELQGDERFFATEGAPPNIHFLVDTSGSMRELPQNPGLRAKAPLVSSGCDEPALDALAASRGWNPATTYPKPDLGTGIGSDNGFANLFVPTSVYRHFGWADSSSPTAWKTSAEDACMAFASDAVKELCRVCLVGKTNVPAKGYFRYPGADLTDAYTPDPYFIFTGNYLNFNPPKYVVARAVLKQVIKNLRRVRAGMSSFDSSGDGASLVQRQNPTCDQIAKDGASWDSNRSSYISSVNALEFTGGTPLAESLFNVGQLFSSHDGIYTGLGFSSSYLKNAYSNDSALGTGNRSWCWGCQVSSVIIITDGDPSTDNDDLPAAKIVEKNGKRIDCPDENGDGQSDCHALETASTDPTKNHDKLDDVAFLLANRDLQSTNPVQLKNGFNSAGKQSLTVYGVGFGHSSPLLKNAAKVGGGEYYEANDRAGLENALLTIISNVEKRATTFAAASISSVQINRTGGSILPRFKPDVSSRPWRGFLYRFELGLEVLLGCDAKKAATILTDPTKGDPYDTNHDGDCEDLALLDEQDRAVVEDDSGNFVLVDSPLELADPYWEAGEVLKASATTATPAWRSRQIYTIIDNGSPGSPGPDGTPDNRIDVNDAPIAFTDDDATATKLMPYLGMSSTTLTSECATIKTNLGLTTFTPLDCAKTVIRWYRGADALSSDPGKRLMDRDFLLHDIFHSAPANVLPPVTKPFCSRFNQCLQSLYGTGTPMDSYTLTSGSVDAYTYHVDRRGKRDQIVLVGSNGGMVHAFHNGSFDGVDADTGLNAFDKGTGRELWAFVMPDMLPKMRYRVGVHGYFVDNNAMVRDVWLDGRGGTPAAADGRKQWTEYRTVAVLGTGAGGVHRLAMDLTDLIPTGTTDAARPPNQAGDILWMWPQPCDKEAAMVGESFSNYLPKPPPIGPVAIADTAGQLTLDGVKAREQWTVFMNGGYDRFLARGHGMSLLDLATGKTLWSFWQGDGSPRSAELKHPVSAGIAMVGYRHAIAPAESPWRYLFDTANVGDMGGQLWTVSMSTPGTLDASGRVTNWYAARSFVVGASSASAARQPFTYITENAVDLASERLYSYLGTGDRYNQMDVQTACRLSNPAGCALQGCKVSLTLETKQGGTTAFKGTTAYDDQALTASTTTAAVGGDACSQASNAVAFDVDAENGCTLDANGSLGYQCSGSGSSWTCAASNSGWSTVSSYRTDLVQTRRFYGIWTYGSTSGAREFATSAEATTYDGGKLTDSNLTNITDGTTLAADPGNGWYYGYDAEERQATAATITRGCVIWSSFIPNVNPAAICSTAGVNTARLFNGQFMTGAKGCAESFVDGATALRYTERTVIADPPEGDIQTSISGGQATISVITLEAGNNQADIVKQQTDLVQLRSQMDVSAAEHACRHKGDSTQCK